jgi:hypothetical protein
MVMDDAMRPIIEFLVPESSMLSAGADTARGPGVALLCESFDKKLYKNF